MVFLSLKNGSTLSISVIGNSQVSPPSTERLTRIALRDWVAVSVRTMAIQ